MSDLIFSDNGWADYLFWQIEDKKTLKKVKQLIQEVQRHPFKGRGKHEPLKKSVSNAWSRRINKKDRLVYEIRDDGILIKQCKGHYEDK